MEIKAQDIPPLSTVVTQYGDKTLVIVAGGIHGEVANHWFRTYAGARAYARRLHKDDRQIREAAAQ